MSLKPTIAVPPRIALYGALNGIFWMILLLGFALGGQSNPRIPYLVLLFVLCSTFVLDLDGLNGRFALLALFLVAYFIFFGLQDVSNLFAHGYGGETEGGISMTEAVILVGGLMLVLGFRMAATAGKPRIKNSISADWPIRSIVIVGIVMSLIGVSATYYWYFFVSTDKTMEGTKAISRMGQWTVAGLILGQMLQPLGTLLLAYAWRSTRRTALLAAVLLAVGVQIILGFVTDIRGMAFAGGVLVILTIVFTEGRLPKAWIAGVVLFIYVAFPVFQAYRAVVTGNVSRVEVLGNLAKTLESAVAAKEKTNSGRERAQTFFERLSMKSSVDMIVRGTANGVPFQDGYTLIPIITAFVPRILWSDKPDFPVGRMVNKAFHVTEQQETYISPSHLGELYWNFGWSGVVLGMAIVGALCGFISRFNLRDRKTLTRLLIMALTVELVIRGFEGALTSYVVWLRCMAGVGLLHLAFARRSASGHPSSVAVPPTEVMSERWPVAAKFPNLLT